MHNLPALKEQPGSEPGRGMAGKAKPPQQVKTTLCKKSQSEKRKAFKAEQSSRSWRED